MNARTTVAYPGFRNLPDSAGLLPCRHAGSASGKRFCSASATRIPAGRLYGKPSAENAPTGASEPASELLLQYLLQHLLVQTQIGDQFLQPLIFILQLPQTTKLLFRCSPNNRTADILKGHLLNAHENL